MPELDAATVTKLVEIGRASAGPTSVTDGNSEFAVVPPNYSLKDLASFKYNDYAERPHRIKQTITVNDPESFIEYLNKFSDENSRVFANEPAASILCVLDYHEAGAKQPRWGSHRVDLKLRPSEEWEVWLSHNNKKFTQTAFAEFLEQNAMDITNPSPGAIMEVARDLSAKTEVEFSSAKRQNDGQVRFKYSEVVKATVGGGELSVPEEFVITIPAFIGGSRVDIKALLRFRTPGGKLEIWYTLVRPQEVARAAFLKARDQIAAELSITIINGAPGQ